MKKPVIGFFLTAESGRTVQLRSGSSARPELHMRPDYRLESKKATNSAVILD